MVVRLLCCIVFLCKVERDFVDIGIVCLTWLYEVGVGDRMYEQISWGSGFYGGNEMGRTHQEDLGVVDEVVLACFVDTLGFGTNLCLLGHFFVEYSAFLSDTNGVFLCAQHCSDGVERIYNYATHVPLFITPLFFRRRLRTPVWRSLSFV